MEMSSSPARTWITMNFELDLVEGKFGVLDMVC